MTKDHDEQQEIILKTIETLLQIQLKSVRQLRGSQEMDAAKPRPHTGLRRQSIVHDVILILTELGRPLHVNELVDLLRQRHGRVTDRDSLSSALAKKARMGLLVRQTGPATFALRLPSGPAEEEKS